MKLLKVSLAVMIQIQYLTRHPYIELGLVCSKSSNLNYNTYVYNFGTKPEIVQGLQTWRTYGLRTTMLFHGITILPNCCQQIKEGNLPPRRLNIRTDYKLLRI